MKFKSAKQRKAVMARIRYRAEIGYDAYPYGGVEHVSSSKLYGLKRKIAKSKKLMNKNVSIEYVRVYKVPKGKAFSKTVM